VPPDEKTAIEMPPRFSTGSKTRCHCTNRMKQPHPYTETASAIIIMSNFDIAG